MPFVDSQGCQIYFRLEGLPTRPLLVLIHSLGADHGMWDPQMPALLTRFKYCERICAVTVLRAR